MRKYNPVRRYLKEPKWLRENLADIPAGKGPLRLCWWHGTTCYVVNVETQHYRLLSDWNFIYTDNEKIPFHTSLSCKRNGVRGCLTVHYTDKDGHVGMLKIDEKLKVRIVNTRVYEKQETEKPSSLVATAYTSVL